MLTFAVVCRRHIPLKLGLNEFIDYTAPKNLDFLGSDFLYFGFIPVSDVSRIDELGIQVCTISQSVNENASTKCDFITAM